MKVFKYLLFATAMSATGSAIAGGFSSDAQQAITGLKAFNSGWNDVSATLDVTSDGKGSIKQHGVAQMHSAAKADNSQKIRIRVQSPAGAKGTAFLSHIASDGSMQQWLFIPATGKVLEVESAGRSGAFLGTEFTFEDLAVHPSRYAVTDATEEDCMVQEQELDCQVITVTPAAGTSSYSRLLAWVDEEDNRLRQVDFFKKDRHVKTLTLESYGQYAGKHWLPKHLTMKNIKTGRSTLLQWKEVKFDQGLSEEEFLPAKLSDGAATTRIGPR